MYLDVKFFFHHLCLPAFSFEQESNPPSADPFSRLQQTPSSWTPPPVLLPFLNLFILNCRHDINRLDLPAPLTHSNHFPSEHTSLHSLCSNPNLTTEPTDKEGTVVVPQHLIFTMDVQSLYACIPHKDGMEALRFFLSHRPNQTPSTDTLIRLAELVFTLNNFSFDSSHFLQTKGGTTGTCMGPSYACLFVLFVEQFLFHNYTGTIPHLFLHYIDDCINAASCSQKELEQFNNFANNFHSALKFTWTISDTSLPFLDLSVSISGNRLITDIYFKPTDSHNYLKYTSSQPTSCKNAIPYSQFLHLRCICSQDEAFYSRTSQISSYFRDRGFPSSGDQSAEHLHSACTNQPDLLVAIHLNSPGNMSILGLLHCQRATLSTESKEAESSTLDLHPRELEMTEIQCLNKQWHTQQTVTGINNFITEDLTTRSTAIHGLPVIVKVTVAFFMLPLSKYRLQALV
eukprot:g45440.t1